MTTETKLPIRFAVVQSGYAVFGVGHTREEAIADAACWMDPAKRSRTEEQVEELLVDRPNDGDFYVLESGDEEFDSYMRAQDAFTLVNGKWFV